jgi:hypothetical protein
MEAGVLIKSIFFKREWIFSINLLYFLGHLHNGLIKYLNPFVVVLILIIRSGGVILEIIISQTSEK